MSNTTSNGRIGCGLVLTIVFIVLKLVGVIHWSWWWVLAPTWIPLFLMLLLFSVAFLLTKN